MERTFYVFLAFLVHSVASQGQIDVDLTDHGKKGIHGGDEGCTNTKLDLVFVLDESSSIWGPDFKAQLQFLSHITEDFRIGPDATQIAVLTFSNRATDHFYLNRYNTAEALQKAIVGIRQQGGGTYTNRALDRMRERYFLAANGGRPGVPKLGIIITDGASRDKALTAAAAAEARAQNITLVAIGVGANIGREELNLIASERKGKPGDKYTYTVENYEALDSIRVELSKVTCEEPAKWSPWTPYSTCSKTCGDGSQTRTRTCPKPGKCPGAAEQTRPCNLRPCPAWTAWTPYGACSVTCGSGTQVRSRRCEEGVPGVDCPGSERESRPCNLGSCRVPAAWTQWSGYGDCSVTCGTGVQSRSRTCERGVAGVDCPGSEVDSRECVLASCKAPAYWSPWTLYEACSRTCGGGVKTRTRVCIGGVAGVDCPGPETDSADCNTQACPQWTAWGRYGECSVTCGGGERSRSRSCITGVPGVDCPGPEKMTERCNEKPCPAWGPFGPFGKCSVDCGIGTYTRTRPCIGGVAGVDCPGSDSDTQPCDAGKCPTPVEDPCCEELDEGDIAFVSDSMNFGGVKGNKAVKFIEDVISDLPIEGGKVQAAVVSNKCLAKMGFFLNTYKDKAAMSEHLHNLPGDEVVQPMLETMRTSYFDPANGARAGARKIGVLVVDDDAKLTYKTMDEIMKAKQNNIELFVVAMSPNIDDFKMQFMADEPRQMHMYKMKDGSAPNIEEMRKQLRNNICTRLMRRKL